MALGYYNKIISSQLDGSALTAAAAASMLPAQAKFTFPANYFNYVGQKLVIEATGRISSVITTPGTARYDIRLGGTVVMDSLAIVLDSVAAHTTVVWTLRFDATLRAVGSAANFMWEGFWACEDLIGRPAGVAQGSLVAMLPWNTAPAVGANFDSTVSQQLDAFFTQTVATGSMTCHQFAVYSPD